jgi:hypothetical protein
MSTGGSIFLDFHLPSATTWFYLSLVLALALFFRFRRLASLQNWDILLLFLLVPGILYLRECQARRQEATTALCQTLAVTVSQASTVQVSSPGLLEEALPWSMAVHALAQFQQADRAVRRGYLLLLLGCAALLLRCLADLVVLRRSSFQPNLTTEGLIWLTAMLLVVFCVTTAVPVFESPKPAAEETVLLERAPQVLASQPVVERFFDIERLLAGITVACHVLIVVSLFWIGYGHFGKAALGASAALLYLLLPYSAYHATDLLHLVPATLLVLMLAVYRLPLLAGLLLGLGCAVAYFPAFLVPLWMSYYYRRGLGRLLLGMGIALAALAISLWQAGTLWQEWQRVLNWPDWRAWDVSRRPTGEGLWSGLELHYAYRVPIFVAYLVLVVFSVCWPRQKNFGHLLVLTTALTIGVQFWYGRAGGTQVLWFAPLMILVVLRPNFRELEDRIVPGWRERLREWWQRLSGRRSSAAASLTSSAPVSGESL